MPRQSRIGTLGALHHKICRGIELSKLFRDKKDRNNFVNWLGAILLETGTPCYAFALMSNHFYLLVKTGKAHVRTTNQPNRP